jgi:nicotinamidase-related amidase
MTWRRKRLVGLEKPPENDGLPSTTDQHKQFFNRALADDMFGAHINLWIPGFHLVPGIPRIVKQFRRSSYVSQHGANKKIKRNKTTGGMNMSQNSGTSKRSEKGLLTPDNCVVALIDHQPQMLFGTSNFDREAIINSTVALGKAARVFDVPVVLTTVETKSFSGNLWPQIRAVFPGQEPIERSSMNSWDDKNFVAAIEKTGRKKIVLAGLWTETCVALPTVQAIHDGYEIYVVEDCCGDVSQLAHDNAMRRVVQAGAKPVTALSVTLEWQRDWANRDTYDAVMDLAKTHYGAYGIGVEYAYTMVHGAPATKLPEYVIPTAELAHK